MVRAVGNPWFGDLQVCWARLGSGGDFLVAWAVDDVTHVSVPLRGAVGQAEACCEA